MEAPEKLYFGSSDKGFLDIYSNRESADEIEYTRTNALIEKACQWLESVNLDFYQIREGVFSMQLVEDFKKYMEE